MRVHAETETKIEKTGEKWGRKDLICVCGSLFFLPSMPHFFLPMSPLDGEMRRREEREGKLRGRSIFIGISKLELSEEEEAKRGGKKKVFFFFFLKALGREWQMGKETRKKKRRRRRRRKVFNKTELWWERRKKSFVPSFVRIRKRRRRRREENIDFNLVYFSSHKSVTQIILRKFFFLNYV